MRDWIGCVRRVGLWLTWGGEGSWVPLENRVTPTQRTKQRHWVCFGSIQGRHTHTWTHTYARRRGIWECPDVNAVFNPFPGHPAPFVVGQQGWTLRNLRNSQSAFYPIPAWRHRAQWQHCPVCVQGQIPLSVFLSLSATSFRSLTPQLWCAKNLLAIVVGYCNNIQGVAQSLSGGTVFTESRVIQNLNK